MENCKNCGKNEGLDEKGMCSYCGCDPVPTRGELYVVDAMSVGFTKEQAVWLHNEFYSLKAI